MLLAADVGNTNVKLGIFDGDNLVGAIRVVDKKDGSRKRVAPVFIMKEFRNKGLAQKAFEEVEKIHGHDNWKLDTILQEEGNCYLYEKLGYKHTIYEWEENRCI